MTVREEVNAFFVPGSDELVLAKEIVTWAHEHPASALHKELKCGDDASAAALWRLGHARRLVAIYVTDEEGDRQTISLSVDRSAEGGYRQLPAVIAIEELYEIAERDALKELRRTEAKYEHLKSFKAVWAEVDKVEAGGAERSRARSRGAPPSAA